MDAEISSILGLEVYTDRGVFVGKVEDAVLDAENGTLSGIAVGSLNRELFDLKGRGIIVPFRWITAVGDIIIMRHTKRAVANKDAPPRE
ncbi:PRC-barrel domain-containing protein [Methanothrix sp.]